VTFQLITDIIDCVLVSLSLRVRWIVDSSNGRFQTKDDIICLCCFYAKRAGLMSKNKNWLARFRIMCPSGRTWVPSDFCFSVLAVHNFLIFCNKLINHNIQTHKNVWLVIYTHISYWIGSKYIFHCKYN